MRQIFLHAALLALAACASTPNVSRVIQGESRGAIGSAESGETGLETEVEHGAVSAREPQLEPQAFSRDELRQEADARLEEMDDRCRALLGPAQEEGASYPELMAASRALIFNADLRIQCDLAFRFDPADLPKPSKLIDAEDGVSSDLKGQVRSLAQNSRDLAYRALELREDDPAARLFSTLGVGLNLWSMGPLQALANGATTTLPKRVGALSNDYPEFEGASPLRLKGRFQSRAPWPYKDKKGAIESLERAVEVAPIPLNFLFLGDAYWIADREVDAVDAWTRAQAADADMETEMASPFLREIARLRVRASER